MKHHIPPPPIIAFHVLCLPTPADVAGSGKGWKKPSREVRLLLENTSLRLEEKVALLHAHFLHQTAQIRQGEKELLALHHKWEQAERDREMGKEMRDEGWGRRARRGGDGEREGEGDGERRARVMVGKGWVGTGNLKWGGGRG